MEGQECFGRLPHRMPFLGRREALGCAGRGGVVEWGHLGLTAKRDESRREVAKLGRREGISFLTGPPPECLLGCSVRFCAGGWGHLNGAAPGPPMKGPDLSGGHAPG
jgi:hypothetical protein